MAPDYEERWAKLGRGENIAPSDLSITPKFSYYEPLVRAADDYVHWAQTPNERIYLGFENIDSEMRGIAPAELCIINGYSHSGKTLALLQILVANRDKRVVYFCPDEPRTLTLIKLACVMHGVDSKQLEQQISSNDRSAISLLKETATEHFPNLAVFDQTVSMLDMERALAEVSDAMAMVGKSFLTMPGMEEVILPKTQVGISTYHDRFALLTAASYEQFAHLFKIDFTIRIASGGWHNLVYEKHN